MSIHIDRLNYEEFYLDYLEGNLFGDVLAAFEAFLEANPDLVIDGEPEVLLPTEAYLDPVIKLAMKQTPDMSQLNAKTLDYFLIARQEGLLTHEQSAQLDHWLEANAQYRSDAHLMQLAKLTPATTDSYTAKNELKRPAGRIVPLPVWTGSAAAAAGLAFFVLFSDGSPDTPLRPADPIAQQRPQKVHVDTNRISGSGKTASPSGKERVENGAKSMVNRSKRQTTVEPAPVVDQLAMRPVEKSNNNMLVPLHTGKTDGGDLPTSLNDLAVASVPVSSKPDMVNPIIPITDRLSAALNTEVDFRTAKAAKGNSKANGGGFYLKIGKFEVSHHSASR